MNLSREGTVSLSTQASEKHSVRGLGSNSNTTRNWKMEKSTHQNASAWEIGNSLTLPNCLQNAWLDTFILLQTVSLKTPLFLIFQGTQKRNMKKQSLLWKCRGLQSWQAWPAISVSCRLSLLGSSIDILMDKAWNLFLQEDSNINKNIKMHSMLRRLN